MNKKENKNLYLLFITYLFACIGWQFINTIIIAYGKEIINIGDVAIASIGGTVAMAGLLSRPFSGYIIDRINGKSIYRISFLLLFFAEIGFVFANNYKSLYLLQIIRGIAWTFINVSGQLIVAKSFSVGKLGTSVSVFMLGGSISNIFSGALAIEIINLYGYSAVFVIAALASLIGAFIAGQIAFETKGNSSNKRKFEFSIDSFLSIKTIPIAAVSFLFQVMIIAHGGGFITNFSRTELNIANVGFYMMALGISGIIGRFAYGKIYDKVGAGPVITCCFLGNSAAFFILSNAADVKELLAAAVIIGLFTTGSAAALQAEAVKTAENGKIGSATSTRGIGNDLGYMFGSVITASIAQTLGTYRKSYEVFFIVNLLAALAAAAVTVLRKRQKN